MSEKKRKPEDVPLGTGLASQAAKALAEKKKRMEKMNKRFGFTQTKTDNN